MLARIRSRVRRPSPSMIVACVALVIALGGTGYAALKLPAGSVGSKQLKKHAVTPEKVAKKTIRLFKGQKGNSGFAGITAHEQDDSIGVSCVPVGVPFYSCSGGPKTITAHCAAGERAINGSYDSGTASTLAGFVVSKQGPDPATGAPTGWSITASYANAYTVTTVSSLPLTVHVICAKA